MKRSVLLAIFVIGLISFTGFLGSLYLDATHLLEMRWKATQFAMMLGIVCLVIGSVAFAKRPAGHSGIEVKPITGGLPVLEQKENDHG